MSFIYTNLSFLNITAIACSVVSIAILANCLQRSLMGKRCDVTLLLSGLAWLVAMSGLLLKATEIITQFLPPGTDHEEVAVAIGQVLSTNILAQFILSLAVATVLVWRLPSGMDPTRGWRTTIVGTVLLGFLVIIDVLPYLVKACLPQ